MDFIIRLAEEFFKKHKRLARYRRIFALLAAVVVFATTYELILPAITMDRQRAYRSPGVEVGVAKDQRKGIEFAEDDLAAADTAGEDAFEAGFQEEGDFFEDGAGAAGDSYAEDFAADGNGSADDWMQAENPGAGDTWENADEIVPGADSAGDDYSGSDEAGSLTDADGTGVNASAGDDLAGVPSDSSDPENSGADISVPENAENDNTDESTDLTDGNGTDSEEAGLEGTGAASHEDGQDLETADGEDSEDASDVSSENISGDNTQDASTGASAADSKETDEATDKNSNKSDTASGSTTAGSGEAVIEGGTAETAAEFAQDGAAAGATDLAALDATGQAAIAVTYPATITYEGKDYTITATFDEKAKLPAEVTLSAVEILPNKVYRDENGDPLYADYEEYYQKTLEALEKEKRLEDDQTVATARFFDITFLDKDGKIVEPAAPVSIAVKYKDALSAVDTADTMAVHFEDNSKQDKTEKVKTKDNDPAEIAMPEILDTKTEIKKKAIQEISFEAESFSVYGVIGTEVITVPFVASDGSTYEVTIDFGKEAGIPENAQLKVTEVTDSNDKYNEYVKQTADAIDSRVIDLNYIKLLDIKIVDEKGNKVTLNSPVHVQIKLLDKEQAEETTQVVHFEGANETPVLIKSSVDGDAVSFSTNGFSIYAVVGEEDQGDYARMNLHFMNMSSNSCGYEAGDLEDDGETVHVHDDTCHEVAMMIVKNSDTRDELNLIVYDPGVGTIPGGTIFKGWSTTASYTVDDAENGMDIDKVRDWAAAHTITENEDVYLYAMLYKNFIVSYLDENNVGVGSENVFMLSTDTSSAYTVNMAYTPKDDTHDFEGWKVSEGGNNIVGYTSGTEYQNGTTITISGNVTFSVNAPEGHWLVFEENGKGATYNAPVFIKSEDETVAPTAPTRFGYDFGGWYTETADTADESGYKQVVETSRYTFGSTIDERTTLYAKWTPSETANYSVLIWKQNVDADGYDFAESISLTGTTGTNVNSVIQQGAGDNAYARINGENKQYNGFYLKEFDQNVKITPEGDAIVNVYYDRIQYTLRFYYARSYDYGGRTYVQVNVNDEGFLQGLKNGRDLNSSLTHIATGRNDFGFFSGGNTWKDVNANGLNGDATKLITNEYKQKVTLGYENIGNYNTYVVTSNHTGNNTQNATNMSVSMRYYYFDVNVYYGQSVVDVWPVPSVETYNVYNGSGYNTGSNYTSQPVSGVGLPIRPIHQGFYATGNGVSGLYSTVDPEMFVGNSKTAYFITYWRFQSAYDVTYNSYFSVLDDETPDVIYHGKGYKLYETFTALTGENWFSSGRATDDGQGWDIGTVTYDGTNYASGNGYVGRVDGQTPSNVINAYYDRVVNHIIYNDGTYVDGNNNPIQNRKEQQLHTAAVVFGSNLTSYNEGKEKYWSPDDTDEYIFEGWYLDSEGQQPYTFTGTMPEHDITVYAKWRQVQYRVFLHPNADDIVDLDWGSDVQAMNFRVSYDETISTPTGRSSEYIFVGWYTDPSCTAQYLFTADTKLNEGTVKADYDKTTDLTDNMDKWGNIDSSSPTPEGQTGPGYNSDAYNYDQETGIFTERDRFWVTKKLDLYAKWRAKLIGANGIGIIYDAGDGSNAPSDDNLYLDQAQATAGAASTAPSGKQFVRWIVQKWNTETGAYDNTSNFVYPGDSFDVLKENARYVITGYINPNLEPGDEGYGEISITQDETHTEVVATYTVQLRAEYIATGTGVPTNIEWYGNNETTSGNNFVVSDTNVMINGAVDVKPADTFTYEGHTFLGWARVPISDNSGVTLDPTLESKLKGKNLSLSELGVADLFLRYDASTGKFVATSVTTGASAGNIVSKVAPDERYPYHAMVAVWEVHTYKVKIEKKVEGITTTQNFTINYDFDDENLTDGNVILAHNGSQTLTADVPYGTVITLTETADGYDKSFSAVRTTDAAGASISPSVAVTAESEGGYKITGDTTITVTNTRQKGNLEVSKATNPNGLADNQTFKVAVKNSEGKYLQSVTNISFGDTKVWFVVSVASKLTINDLPTDTYTVEEDPSVTRINGYRYDGASFSVGNGVISVAKNETAKLAITNNYTKLASVTVTKKLDDSYPEGLTEFTFTPTLTENGENVTSEYFTNLTSGTFKLTPVGDGSTKTASIKFDNLPVGAVLNVTETVDENDRYTTTVKTKVNGGEAEGSSLTIADGTNEIEFTNTRKTYVVDFKKTAVDGSDLNGATFTLNILSGSYINYPDGSLTLGTGTMKLVPGDYELFENKSPNGYIILSDKIRFTVSQSGTTGSLSDPTKEDGTSDTNIAVKQSGSSEGSIGTIVVKNTPGQVLPHTGGSGILVYTLSGLALVLASALMYVFRMRRRERRLR